MNLKIKYFQKNIIGKNVKIYKDCYVKNSTIYDSVTLYRNSFVRNSELFFNSFVSDDSRVDKSILKEYSRTGRFSHCYNSILGRHTYIGQNTVVMCSEIGNFSSIAWNVTIGGAEHDYHRITSHTSLYNLYDKLNDNISDIYDRFSEHCIIGNDVWIGSSSTILRNVEIGDGAVVGANSIVTKDVPPYSIVVGNPAKIVGYRFDKKIIEYLLEIKWWEYSDSMIKDIFPLLNEKPNIDDLDKMKKILGGKK